MRKIELRVYKNQTNTRSEYSRSKVKRVIEAPGLSTLPLEKRWVVDLGVSVPRGHHEDIIEIQAEYYVDTENVPEVDELIERYFNKIASVRLVLEVIKDNGSEIWVFVKNWNPEYETEIIKSFKYLRKVLPESYEFFYHPDENIDPYSLFGAPFREVYVNRS